MGDLINGDQQPLDLPYGLSIDPHAQQFLTKSYSKSWC